MKKISNKKRKLSQINKTPLHWAVEKNSTEFVKFLISNEADVDIKDVNYLRKILVFITKIIRKK